jgi:hypothetical protein
MTADTTFVLRIGFDAPVSHVGSAWEVNFLWAIVFLFVLFMLLEGIRRIVRG